MGGQREGCCEPGAHPGFDAHASWRTPDSLYKEALLLPLWDVQGRVGVGTGSPAEPLDFGRETLTPSKGDSLPSFWELLPRSSSLPFLMTLILFSSVGSPVPFPKATRTFQGRKWREVCTYCSKPTSKWPIDLTQCKWLAYLLSTPQLSPLCLILWPDNFINILCIPGHHI